MKTLVLFFITCTIAMNLSGQNHLTFSIQVFELQKSIDFKIPQSIFFIIKGDVSQFKNFVVLSNQLKNEFKETGILVHTDFDFSDSETKVVDKDIMVLDLTGLDRDSFETEMLLDFTSLKTDKSLRFALKSKEGEMLIQGHFEFLENEITPETSLSISNKILALFD